MTTYICRNCDVKIKLENNGSGSAFAEICPCCQKEDSLEYV